MKLKIVNNIRFEFIWFVRDIGKFFMNGALRMANRKDTDKIIERETGLPAKIVRQGWKNYLKNKRK